MKRKLLSLLLCLSMLLSLCVSANAEAVSSEAALTAAIEQGTDVQLQNNITLSAPLTVEKTMTLDLNGKTLTYTGNGSIITVKNATLTIIDSGAEYVDGVLRKYGSITSQNTATSEKGGGLYIDDGGTVELTAGALLECAASKNGGGVYVAYGGKLHMTGDSMIQSCKAPAGGGMYIELGGIATMDGGRISSCTASREGDAYGGGVYLESPTSRHDETMPYGFRMTGGTIQNCSASSDTGSAYGGGVYISGFSGSIFEMAGGSIENCKVIGSDKACGGGVYLNGYDDKFTMTAGTITGCTAQCENKEYGAYGGGVYAKANSVFEMKGGSIDGTCTSYRGNGKDNGGLYLWMATMLAHGGTVDCTVLNQEGTIKIDENPSSITTFNDAVINDQGDISGGTFNRAVDNGTNSTLASTISGGTFYGSVINGKRSEISGGTFHGTVTNEADNWPGGHIGTIGGGSFDETPYGAFTVTFDVRGGTPVPKPQVRVNALATAPNPDPTKDDQKFLGWYTDSECTQRYGFTDEFKERILADTTLYALWSDDRCAMTFDSNGGSEVEPQLLLISGDKAAEPLDPTKEGATFLGWFTESGKHWNFTHDSVTGNITLRAMWSDGATPTPPTTVAVTGVTLDQTALTLAKDSSAALTAAVEPANATNKTVSWWSTDTSVAAVSSDGTVTAGKAGMALIVARTADGNYIATCTVTVPEDTPKPTHPAKPNIQVTGTYTYNGAVQTAKVTGYDPDTMNITGNTATNAGSCTVAVTSKTGKWADGSSDAVTAMWSIGKATQDAPTGLAGVAPSSGNGSDGKITGVTDRMEYHPAGESSYKACSGTEIKSISAGTYFIRYAEDNNHFASPDATVTVGEDTPLADCEITFDPNGGTGSMKSVTVKAGTNYILPACGFTAPAGQKFKAWEIGGRSYNVGDPYTVNGDTRIKAVFEEVAPVAYYTLRFETDGGSAIASVRGTYNTYIDLIKYIPTRHGHTFIGWYSDSSLTKRVSGVYLTEDTTVYAGWRTARNTIPDGGGNAAGSAGTVGRTDTKRLESQKTGDSSNLAVWSALLFASGTAIGTMAVSRRKKCGR